MNGRLSALEFWRRKLEQFRIDEAITSSPEKRFELAELIREASQKIDELEAQQKAGRFPDDSLRVPNPEKDRGKRLRIFISYSFQDLALVRQLRTAFAVEGHSVWIAEEDAKRGPWPPQITAAIRSCDLFVIAFTARSRESEIVQNEILEAHKQGRQMLIVRLESGVDLGECDAILNVCESFDWKTEQIPQILQKLDELDVCKSSQPLVSPTSKSEKPLSFLKYFAIAAVVLLVAGAGVWFKLPRTGPQEASVAHPDADLVLAVLPDLFNDDEQKTLLYCGLLRSPLGSVFAGASKLSFWPEQSEPRVLSKAAQDFSDSQNHASVPTGACVAVFATLLTQKADPPSAELQLTFRVRETNGDFSPSLSLPWCEFRSKHHIDSFTGPADSARLIATRAGVELARFLVEEGLIQIKDKDRERLTANLTAVLLEAAVASNVQSKIPAELYESSINAPTESRLEALLNVLMSETRPAITAKDKAAIEVKANIAPFTRL